MMRMFESKPIDIPVSSKKIKRKRFNFQENHTAALSLSVSNEELELGKNDPRILLDEAKDNIIEHAIRRVELFFYTLIAYYNKKYHIDRGHTFLQFGKGRNSQTGASITQGCHSSFFGSFIDNSMESEEEHSSTPHSILSHTHLLHSLNATMELPAFVNKLDDELENSCQCRVNGLHIIQEVSSGELDPIEGMRKFFLMMEKAFSDLEKPHSTYLSADTADSPKVIKPALLKLVREGTFDNKWNNETQKVQDDYIELILRLPKHEKFLCHFNDQEREKVYESAIKKLQEEILQMEDDTEFKCRF